MVLQTWLASGFVDGICAMRWAGHTTSTQHGWGVTAANYCTFSLLRLVRVQQLLLLWLPLMATGMQAEWDGWCHCCRVFYIATAD